METTEEATRIMVITAHPDDADFVCGGSVARWAAEGNEIIYVLCTSGNKGTNDPSITPEQLAALREAEQQQAARILGVKEVVFMGYPDGGLEDIPQFRKDLVKLVRKHRPKLVVTHDPYRWQHRDHRMVGRVTLDAVYPYARDRLHYPEFLAQGLLPHKVDEVYLFGAEEPDEWVDITDYWERKIEAARCHKSQIRDPEGFEARWRERVAEASKNGNGRLTEAFKKVRFVW